MTTILRPLLLAALVAGCATASGAETFRVLLGGRQLGTLEYTGGESAGLVTTLDNTPLGVADGVFDATSGPVRRPSGETVRQYVGANDERTVSVLLDGGTVVEVRIDPRSERTDLSEPSAVPSGVLDPVMAFGHFLGSGGCPEPFRMYDGRRVIRIATTGQTQEGDKLTCALDYRVTAGPGHLSPLGISRLAMTLTYAGGVLTEVTARTGPFSLRLAR